MAWIKTVGVGMKNAYSHSKDIVYNHFPWTNPTDAQKDAIEKTAQAILTARAPYSDFSFADFYDKVTMPPELRKAHRENDGFVMRTYGFDKD